jgi:hypothetical protein
LQIVQIYRLQDALAKHLGKHLDLHGDQDDEDDLEYGSLDANRMLQDYFKALQNLEWTTKQNQLSWSDGKKHAIRLDQHLPNPNYQRT